MSVKRPTKAKCKKPAYKETDNPNKSVKKIKQVKGVTEQ